MEIIPMLKFLDSHWKALTFSSVIFLVFCSLLLAMNYARTGYFIERDIELKGGKLITIAADADPVFVQSLLPGLKISKTSGLSPSLLIEASFDTNDTAVVQQLEARGISGETSVRTIGPALGEVFWQQTQLAIIIAFGFMMVVVFILFRSPAPCTAVILAAATDIVGTVAVMSIFRIDLSLAALGALMMLIGYSVDTDVLLTTEMLKSGEGDLANRIRSAAKTGLTMSMATISVLIAIYLVSSSLVIKTIAVVLLIGLLIDLPATWVTNAGVLRWWMERKK